MTSRSLSVVSPPSHKAKACIGTAPKEPRSGPRALDQRGHADRPRRCAVSRETVDASTVREGWH
jgi:hypothetical protein